MKITQVIRGITRGGGASLVACELQRKFISLNVDSNVLAGFGDSVEQRRLICTICGMFERFLPIHIGQFFSVLLFTILSSLAVLVRKNSPTVYLIHSDCLLGDIRVVHSVHKRALKMKIKNKELKFLLNPLHYFGLLSEQIFYRYGFNKFIAVSESVKREIRDEYGIYETCISAIPNGVDTRRFTPDQAPSHKAKIMEEVGTAPDSFLLLFAGHEFGRKGLRLVVSALPHVHADGKVALLVLGRDNQVPFKALAKKNKVADRIYFLGARPDIERYMAAADLFVLPSYYEPFGLVCIEALASGTPVLATKTGGIVDYLEDTVNGLFIDSDPVDIAAKITLLLNDPAGRCAMGAAARKSAERFSWDNVATRYLDVIHQVAEEKKRGAVRC